MTGSDATMVTNSGADSSDSVAEVLSKVLLLLLLHQLLLPKLYIL